MRKFDEKRIVVHPTGYNYVRVTPGEVRNWGGYNICNGCNGEFLDSMMNLCWACTDTYCDKCFERMMNSWYELPEEDVKQDLRLQDEMSLDWYKYHLDDEFRAKVLEENKKTQLTDADILAKALVDDDFEEFLKSLDF